MRNQTWPAAAKIRDWSLGIVAHSRGDTGAGGHYEFERGPGAKWSGTISVPPMTTANALAFRAFLHSLRGRSGTFYLTMPSHAIAADTCTNRSSGLTRFTDCTRFSDGTQFSDAWTATAFSLSGTLTSSADAGATSVKLSKIGALAAGDTLLIGGQLLRVISISGFDVTVRPRLRSAVTGGTAFSAGAVAGLFRLTTDAPIVPLVNGRSLDVTLEIEEAY